MPVLLLPPTVANRVYDVLVAKGGATNADGWREMFVRLLGDGCSEYRFQGVFGFGGKFWPERFKVNYYPEDKTPERERLMAEVNAALAEIKTAWQKGELR